MSCFATRLSPSHDNCYKRDMVGLAAWRRMEPDVLPAWLAEVTRGVTQSGIRR